ncbi:hypothetical protein SCYAM73S_06796 [Streptomyces cyaneofuscatus]
MGYPSPIGPDFYDNPKFPGKLICGGLGYDSDTVWGRNTAVPAFQAGHVQGGRLHRSRLPRQLPPLPRPRGVQRGPLGARGSTST